VPIDKEGKSEYDPRRLFPSADENRTCKPNWIGSAKLFSAWISLAGFLREITAAFAILFYLALCFLAYAGLDDRSFSAVSRHVFLVPGIIPLICWLAFLLSNGRRRAYLLGLATGATCFHVFLFAVSAHSDGMTYWLVQLVEMSALWFLGRANKPA
jgi:hypothetical protein